MPVKWHDDALDQLADIWVTIAPKEREVIERTVNEINAHLASDPWDLGESRENGQRVWFHHPLVVVFRLIPGGGVSVANVAMLRLGRTGDNGRT